MSELIEYLRQTARYSRERFDDDGVMLSVIVEPFADGFTIKAARNDNHLERIVSFEEIEAARYNIILERMPEAAKELLAFEKEFQEIIATKE